MPEVQPAKFSASRLPSLWAAARLVCRQRDADSCEPQMKIEIADWLSKANNKPLAVPRMFARSTDE
jgi:hypothetical protein